MVLMGGETWRWTRHRQPGLEGMWIWLVEIEVEYLQTRQTRLTQPVEGVYRA